MQFRYLTIDDLDSCLKVEQSAGPYPWSEYNYRQTLKASKPVLGLWSNDQLLALCAYQQVVDEATILNICVDGREQGRGLGAKLLQEVLNRLLASESRVVFLEVRAGNLAAQHLYQKLGFNEVNRRLDYYPLPNGSEDAIEMAVELI
jgi:ribosomal-protein-alanine N-acetyltransferase